MKNFKVTLCFFYNVKVVGKFLESRKDPMVITSYNV